MKWLGAAFRLIMLASVCSPVTGVANTSLSCNETVSPFAPMTLECRYAGEVVTGIQWLKPNADVMMRCDNSSRKCVLDERVKDKDNYVIRYSRNSVILTLRKLDPRQHIGVWACRDGETGLTAKCTNQLTSRITMDCKTSTKIVCKSRGTLYAPMAFIRPDGSKIAECNEQVSSCLIAKDYEHNYTIEGVVPTLTIKRFSLEHDVGTWKCTEGDIAVTSSCLNQQRCHLSCKHGGTLDRRHCTCECPDKWIGDECEYCKFDCSVPNGILFVYECECVCSYRWSGLNCDVCSLPCANGEIQNETCACRCDAMWAGSKCDTCDVQCANGGSVLNESCSCRCRGEWSGDECEIRPPQRMTGFGVAALNMGVITLIALTALLVVWIVFRRRQQKAKGARTDHVDTNEPIYLTTPFTN